MSFDTNLAPRLPFGPGDLLVDGTKRTLGPVLQIAALLWLVSLEDTSKTRDYYA